MSNKDKDDDYYYITKEGLKSTIKPSPLEEILRCRYKYTSCIHNDYILAEFAIGLDCESRAYWSKYSNDDSIIIAENQVMLSDDFDKMIESEGYIEESHETVVCA